MEASETAPFPLLGPSGKLFLSEPLINGQIAVVRINSADGSVDANYASAGEADISANGQTLFTVAGIESLSDGSLLIGVSSSLGRTKVK